MPCFMGQMTDAARLATDDPELRQRWVRIALRELAEWPFELPPPMFAGRLHARLRELTGTDDPYAQDKRRANELALALLPELRELVAEADDAFAAAVKLACAGNLLDMGVKTGHALDPDEVEPLLRGTLEEPPLAGTEELREALEGAQNVLLLADNAGEIVLDRLLVEQLDGRSVTVAVRGGPIINDVTLQDARDVGMTQVARVVSNGARYPGTVLEECSGEFRREFDGADLLISKGQGNYETLNDCGRDNLFFLLRIKCNAVSRETGLPAGSPAIIRA
jgi:hypothetical protein